MRTSLLILVAALSSPALAQSAAPKPPPKPAPTDAECPALPLPKGPFAFAPGERLEFSLDALGAEAGKMTMRVLPPKDGQLPIEVKAETNTFFAKVRRVKATGMSYLNPKTLRPSRYVEDATENEVHRTVNVGFVPAAKKLQVASTVSGKTSNFDLRYGNDAFDPASVIYLLRQLPLKAGLPVCFDVYGIRRVWRLSGKVEGLEDVTSPLGAAKAWHLVGEAVRLDNPASRREVHVWISDDAKRLPLAAVGVIDLGAIRATLTAVSRPGEKQAKIEGKETLKW